MNNEGAADVKGLSNLEQRIAGIVLAGLDFLQGRVGLVGFIARVVRAEIRRARTLSTKKKYEKKKEKKKKRKKKKK